MQQPSVPVLLDTLRLSLERFQAVGVDQVVLDLQAVEGDIVAVLDRYAAALAAP